MRIGIVVGEASGDILGAGLMEAILRRYPKATFEGIGGERMMSLGFESFFQQDRLAVMGFIEPMKRIFELMRMRRFLVEYFISNPPDLFIGIDSPDFNLGIEGRLKAAGIKTAHYVSPSVWAWRQRRIHKIARSVDLMLTLLPFEAAFYEKHQVPVCFVGHPLADSLPIEVDQRLARETIGVDQEAKIITLMPGSRSGEVGHLGPDFWLTAQWCLARDPNLKFLVPAVNASRRKQIEEQLDQLPEIKAHIQLFDGQSHYVMAASDVVMMASGTTTLEAMLLKRPMVVTYRMGKWSFWLVSKLVKSRFISLPNLLADEALVPEILQDEVKPEVLGPMLLNYLNNQPLREELQQRFTAIHHEIKRGASERAAVAVLELIGAPTDLSDANEAIGDGQG